MNAKNMKVAGALASGVLLAGTGVAIAAPILNVAVDNDVAVEQNVTTPVDGVVRVANAQGQFAYTQGVTTSNPVIANVFQGATSAVCNLLSKYDTALEWSIAVGGDVPSAFTATLSQLTEEDGVVSYLMGCACSANQAGGGAIVNAQVSGVPVASIAAKAGL